MKQFFNKLIFAREVNYLLLSIFLFALAIGMNFVTFPSLLNERGFKPSDIGIFFACELSGGILMLFVLNKIVARLNFFKTLRISSICYAAIVLLIFFCKNIFFWGFFVFLLGALWAMYVITRQAWFSIIIPKERREIALGILSMIISAGLALGPVIVKLSGATNYFSFVISAILTFSSFYCLTSLNKIPEIKIESKKISLKKFFKNNPQIFVARFCLDFQTFLILTFSVIFGIKTGLTPEASGLLITAFMASFIFDVFASFIIQKHNPYNSIKIGFIGCLTCFLSIAIFHNFYKILLIIYFIMGFFFALIYIGILVINSRNHTQEQLVSANTTLQLIGSIGSICGSLIGGYLINFIGILGFPITISLSCIAYLSFLIIHEKKTNQTRS